MAQCGITLRPRACWSTCPHTRCLLPLHRARQASRHNSCIQIQKFSLARLVRAAASSNDVQPVPDLLIPQSDLECDRKWISGMVAVWLDEEWTPLDVHKELGRAAGDAYIKCRQQGDDDMSSLVLGMSNELLAFNYRETFTSAFEVANKVVEMLMMRSGVDVCCTTDEDAARIERFNSQASEQSQ